MHNAPITPIDHLIDRGPVFFIPESIMDTGLHLKR